MRTVAFLCLFSVGVLQSQTLPPAPKAHLVDINPQPGYLNEPSIAVNPGNAQQLVVAWQVNASAASTSDGGQTWAIAEGTAPKDYRVSGDVSVTFDSAGRAQLAYIAFDKLGASQYWARGATRNGIFVRRSLDGGKTWEENPSTVIAHESAPSIPFEDKPYIVADILGPHPGNLYIGWTQFTLNSSDLLFSRSSDGGQSWWPPIKLNSVPGMPRDDNGAVEGFDGVVGPDGTLYTIWDNRDGIMMGVSRDGGQTFTHDRRIIPAGPGYFGIAGVSRCNGFPQIGVDPRSKKERIAHPSVGDSKADSNNARVAQPPGSPDRAGVPRAGVEAPPAVQADTKNAGVAQAPPPVQEAGAQPPGSTKEPGAQPPPAAKESKSNHKHPGKLYVAWSDYTNGDVDIFVASSTDRGKHWSAPVRVNNDPIHNGNDQFFEWMAVDPQSGAVNLVFYDRRGNNLDTTVTLARSTDGGKTFTNYAWDTQSFVAEGDFLGDYVAITAFGNKVFAAWAHQTSEPQKEELGKRTRTVIRVGTADFN